MGPGPSPKPHGRQPPFIVEQDEFRTEMVRLIPALRAFARSLTRDRAAADDLVQDSLVKALANAHRFTRGSNLKAWLFTIQRRTFYTQCRTRRRNVRHEPDECGDVASEPRHEWSMEMRAVDRALQRLPAPQSKAIMLVGWAGFGYEEAAAVCGCTAGTIKSRVSRGRRRLVWLLRLKTGGELFRGDLPRP